MKIVITQEDVIGTEYTDPQKCPMAKALQKALNNPNIQFCWANVSEIYSGNIGKIKPQFTSLEFEKLRTGEITEFVTEYTPNT